MQLTNFITILASASVVLSAALPASEDTSLTTRSKTAQYVTYCANPSTCAEMLVEKEDCQTFAEGFPLLTFDAGLKCDVYENGSCTKRFLSHIGKVSNVQGAFDTSSDPRAIKNKVTTVGSFTC